jgi:S-adenosylmethionine-diacylglycerol 3-amino-3-carboxypropyl transferase
MSDDLTKRVNFEIIRYANCWEDADILLEGLSPKAGSKILSIGSAGDNSFSLLATNPEFVVAVDVNKIQLYLIELKKTCIKNFNYEEVLQFLGFLPSEKREANFNSIKNELSTDARNYWEKNIQCIKDGVIYQGKFENYFCMFSGKILPWIHSKKTVKKLFLTKTQEEQTKFYNEKWNSWRWRLLFKIFFSKYVMGKFGRDPEFLKEVKVTVSEYIYKKAGNHLQTKEAQENFMLHFNLTGNFGTLLPNYLQKENFKIIKSNIGRLKIKDGYAQDAISEFGKFHCMNLSNIFEYMDQKLFSETAESLINGTEKGGKLAYWNLMVPRRISAIFPDKAEYEKEISLALSQKDKGFFYSQFIVDTIK